MEKSLLMRFLLNSDKNPPSRWRDDELWKKMINPMGKSCLWISQCLSMKKLRYAWLRNENTVFGSSYQLAWFENYITSCSLFSWHSSSPFPPWKSCYVVETFDKNKLHIEKQPFAKYSSNENPHAFEILQLWCSKFPCRALGRDWRLLCFLP